MSEQLDLPLPRVSVQEATRDAMRQIELAVQGGNYHGTVVALSLFMRVVWDVFFRKPLTPPE